MKKIWPARPWVTLTVVYMMMVHGMQTTAMPHIHQSTITVHHWRNAGGTLITKHNYYAKVVSFYTWLAFVQPCAMCRFSFGVNSHPFNFPPFLVLHSTEFSSNRLKARSKLAVTPGPIHIWFCHLTSILQKLINTNPGLKLLFHC